MKDAGTVVPAPAALPPAGAAFRKPGPGLKLPPGGLARRRPGFSLNLNSLEAGAKPAARAASAMPLPEELQGKELKFFGEFLGKGSNGFVTDIAVDGKKQGAYVAKAALMQSDRPSMDASSPLAAEIAMNERLAKIAETEPLPNILLMAGTATIEGQQCMLMPKMSTTLRSQLAARHQQVLDGTCEPQAFVDDLKAWTRGPASGLGTLHRHGVVMNDLNVGNLMVGFDGVTKVIDFGCAGSAGEHKKPGTVGTIAPERIKASDGEPVDKADPDAAALAPSADCYSFGAVLHALVHEDYPTWSDASRDLEDEAQLLELSSSTAEFRKRGSIFPKEQHPARQAGLPENEGKLRECLERNGYYDLIEALMDPDAAKRLSLADAVANHRFFT